MAYWLVKSEPSTWSWDQQVAKGAKGEAWTGVRNFTARQNLVKMKKGDRAFFYHSNEGKEIDRQDRKIRLRRHQGRQAAENASDDGRDQGRQETRRDGAGEILAAVGAAGHGGGVEARLQDGRDVASSLSA
jgi:predicted RNA-binding protein with PUA-like domain